jgi:hypothetical protein
MKADTAGARETRRRENAKKAREAAEKFFPGEKWVKVEDGIYLSTRRPIGKKTNYPDELRDAQILRDGGGAVYLAPDDSRQPGKKFDAIVDGMQMEFKNMRGKSKETLIDHFYSSRGQAPHVFINLEDSPLSKHKILRFLIGARNSPKYDEKNRFPEGGTIILKIKGHRNLIYQEVNDIRS